MFRFLYVTDLHGWTAGYQAVMDEAFARDVSAVVNGGDVLPKQGQSHVNQPVFIEEYMPAWLEALGEGGIEYWAMLGNDDLRVVTGAWREMMGRFDTAHDLTDGWQAFGPDLAICGLNCVPDHPFGLKDLSVLDSDDFRSPPQFGRAVVSTPTGYDEIDDLHAFLKGRPTIETLLDEIASDADGMDRALLVSHSPPAGAGLATIGGGLDVGSQALRRWIEVHQPLLTLHGHIHESPDVSGVHTARIGRTVAHQPGQDVPFAGGPAAVTMSVVTLADGAVDIERLRIPV